MVVHVSTRLQVTPVIVLLLSLLMTVLSVSKQLLVVRSEFAMRRYYLPYMKKDWENTNMRLSILITLLFCVCVCVCVCLITIESHTVKDIEKQNIQ